MTDLPGTAAVILAAGRGERLRPLTDTVAKPLVPVLDRPILDHVLARVWALGAIPIHVNLHHHADELAAHLASVSGPASVTRVEERLSGPAGALRVFADLLRDFETVLVLSGDVVFADGLRGLVEAHRDRRSDLTFAVTMTDRASRYGVLDIDESRRVVGAREKPAVPDHERHWISAGLYCLRSSLISEIPADRTYDYAADLAPALLARTGRVFAHPLDGYWNDVGRMGALREANLVAAEGAIPGLEPRISIAVGGVAIEGPVHIGEDARIGEGTTVVGPAVIGAGAVVGTGCWVEQSVILPGSVLPPGSVLEGALLAGGPHR